MNALKQIIIGDISDSIKSIGLNKLNEIIHKSEKEEREYAIKFCRNEHIYPSDICIGTKCRIALKEDKSCKNQIGTFHTHHHIKNTNNKHMGYLSGPDIYSTILKKRDFSCIGLIEDNKPTIKCFIPVLDISPPDDLKNTIYLKLN